ncbi:MAG: Gfo/Idh/MocA family oxidoreductase [Candidatus Marinimicrobia bacterium]|nr:Gfo/Idh/MocA family oxidoreductase [Candidatus Neomarinimicrobiota bacterium]
MMAASDGKGRWIFLKRVSNLPAMVVKRTKMGVIGVGHLGKFHVQQLLEIADAEIIGLHDIDPAAASEVGAQHAVPVFDNLDDLLAQVDAVSIVVSTRNHFTVASRALAAGCHVFIEKPITPSLEEADQLLKIAERRDLLVQVGHIERLNPALTALEELAPNPRFIEGHRLAPFTSRGTDVPVVLDLMIHDIDVVLSLVKSPLKEVRASGVAVITDSADIATARLEFENGAVANLTASRISQKQMRKLRLFQNELYISIDFLQQLTEVYRLVPPDGSNEGAAMTMPFSHNGRERLITYEKPHIADYNPLRMELSNFVRSVAGLEKPVVDGHSARAALDVAAKIQAAIDGNPLHVAAAKEG